MVFVQLALLPESTAGELPNKIFKLNLYGPHRIKILHFTYMDSKLSTKTDPVILILKSSKINLSNSEWNGFLFCNNNGEHQILNNEPPVFEANLDGYIDFSVDVVAGINTNNKFDGAVLSLECTPLNLQPNTINISYPAVKYTSNLLSIN